MPDAPLEGRTVLVTHDQEQQGEGRRQLEQLGAQVIDLPALVIGPPDEWPLDDALDELDEFHCCCSPAPTVCGLWRNGCSVSAAWPDAPAACASLLSAARQRPCWSNWSTR